ncbi:MAG: HEAT repeat domain-containing protein [Ignavibacteriales bacterium]|nr:HEAT repeat domain-containing protein [Ignavibacteriales bacterium]
MKNSAWSVILLLLLVSAFCFGVFGQTIVQKNIEEYFDQVHKEAITKGYRDGYWIGYSIKKSMEENSFIGSYSSDDRRNRPSLAEVISGVQIKNIDEIKIGDNDCQIIEGNVSIGNSNGNNRKIEKEVGILFHFDRTGNKIFDEIKISNLSLKVTLKNDPLIWLNSFDNEESVSFLVDQFNDHYSIEIQEDIVRAAGIHDPGEKGFLFLKEILIGDYKNSIREESAFWIGQQNTDAALTALMQAAQKDKSEDVMEKAVFSVSEMENKNATDSLVKLARKAENRNVRNKAIFWLSQRASEKAVAVIEDIIQNDDDTEVQKQVVFAISQLDDEESIPSLIKIARSHPSVEVRKSAIFWLGQTEDSRALDAIVEMVKN